MSAATDLKKLAGKDKATHAAENAAAEANPIREGYARVRLRRPFLTKNFYYEAGIHEIPLSGGIPSTAEVLGTNPGLEDGPPND